jgi:GNAT superfamily N-acetyltransferase
MTRVTLRAADVRDLDAVVGVFLHCFQESYAAHLPARVTEAFDEEQARSLWSSALIAPDRQVVVAELDDELCGVVGFQPSGTEGWVHSLYVHPAAQGARIGSQLLRYATERLTKAGCAVAYLWVFEANTPSVRFYARHGWHPDGARRVEERFGENEIRLSRSLEVAA